MTDQEIFDKVAGLIAQESNGRVTKEQVKPDEDLEADYGFDSMEMGALSIAISTKFGIQGKGYYSTAQGIVNTIKEQKR